MDSAECVCNYKSLANVKRAFHSLKTVDLKVRPIHHRTADRVRAHIFLCMLAYHVEWHMREVWRELMFADTDSQAKEGPTSGAGWIPAPLVVVLEDGPVQCWIRSFRIFGSASSSASKEWQSAQSWGIVRPSVVLCSSSWHLKQPVAAVCPM